MNTIYIYHALKKENLRTKSFFYIISSLPGKLLLIYNLSMQSLFGPTGRSVSLPCNQHINSFPKQILNDANYPQYQHVHESGHLLIKQMYYKYNYIYMLN